MTGIVPMVDLGRPDPSALRCLGAARLIAALVLGVWIALALASQPAHADGAVDAMIAEYQRLQQARQTAAAIVANEQDHAQADVQNAIIMIERLDGVLAVLGNQIVAGGGKIPGPAGGDPPASGESGGAGDEEAPAEDAELVLTARQQSDIRKEEQRIRVAEEKLSRYEPGTPQAEAQIKLIARSKSRIEKIRAKASRVLRVRPGGTVEADADGPSAKTKAPAVPQPWKLGRWTWRFDPADKFEGLKEKYERLQTELGALLLVERERWTHDQAIKYTGRLSTLCQLIINTEEDIAFGLGDRVQFERGIKAHKREWNKYLAEQKKTDDARAAYEKTKAEYYALLKKSGLKPGDTVPSDDANAQKLNQLAAKSEQQRVAFEALQVVSERAKYASGVISEARERGIKSGVSYTEKNPPKLTIHRQCKNEPSLIYAMFLSDKQYDTFHQQAALRRAAE